MRFAIVVVVLLVAGCAERFAHVEAATDRGVTVRISAHDGMQQKADDKAEQHCISHGRHARRSFESVHWQEEILLAYQVSRITYHCVP